MKQTFLILALCLLATNAFASDKLRQCFAVHNECVNNCFNEGSEGTQSACIAQCAGSEAQCAGKIGLESSEPYLRKKADQLEKLMNEFFHDILPIPSPEDEDQEEHKPMDSTQT